MQAVVWIGAVNVTWAAEIRYRRTVDRVSSDVPQEFAQELAPKNWPRVIVPKNWPRVIVPKIQMKKNNIQNQWLRINGSE
jgi:hypothetical protein